MNERYSMKKMGSFLFSWKSNAKVNSIESCLSDSRLISTLKLIQSVPFPQSTQDETKNKYEVNIEMIS